jgi:hypothetical protein
MKTTKIIFISFLIFGALSFTLNSSDDVVTPFENLLKKHFESYITNPREKISKLGGGWVKEHYKLFGEYKYDVQQTNSLVTPYTAYCEFKLKRSMTSFHKTKEEANLDTIFTKSDLIIHKHYYSYQKGKWIVSKRTHKGYDGIEDYDCKEVISEGENKGETDLEGCWELNFSE